MKSIALPALVLLAFLSASQADDPEVVRGETGERLDEYLSALEGVGCSGVVGALAAGEPVLLKGYGLADREAGTPVTPDTVFSVGSITKQFTATAILVLADEGRLHVQDSIADFFADVPPDKQRITLHHLLSHGAGLENGYADDRDLQAADPWVLARALAQPLRSQPGTKSHYSNAGYSLVGMIVERVSGQGYEEFLRQRLFEPAGMKSTGYFAPGFGHRVAIGYDRGQRRGTVLERPRLQDGPCWNLRGNGGIHSTVGDMLRYADDDVAIFMATNVAQDFSPMTWGPARYRPSCSTSRTSSRPPHWRWMQRSRNATSAATRSTTSRPSRTNSAGTGSCSSGKAPGRRRCWAVER